MTAPSLDGLVATSRKRTRALFGEEYVSSIDIENEAR
jgi:hypothetical protein